MPVLKHHSIVGCRAAGLYVCGLMPVLQRHSIVGWCLCRWSGASSASVHGFSVLQVSSEGLGLQVERVGVLRQLRYLLRCNLLQNTTMIMINVFTERQNSCPQKRFWAHERICQKRTHNSRLKYKYTIHYAQKQTKTNNNKNKPDIWNTKRYKRHNIHLTNTSLCGMISTTMSVATSTSTDNTTVLY